MAAARPPSLVGPIWAVSLATALITLGGLGMIFAFAMVVITHGVTISGGMMLIALSFLFIVLTVAILLTRQLSRLLSGFQPTNEAAQPQNREVEGQPPAQLEAARSTPASVTENTTRVFEPSHGERQTR